MTSPADQDSDRLLELYKLGAELADRVSARRSTANAFFLTAESALVTVVTFVIGKQRPSLPIKAAVVAVGVLLSASWWLQLRSYRDLNRAKFDVLTALEERLPYGLFAEEQLRLWKDPVPGWRERYAELGTSERIVPWLFALLWLLLLGVI